MDHPPIPEWVNLDYPVWCSTCGVDYNCTFKCLASHMPQFACHNKECPLHSESVHLDPDNCVLYPWVNAPHQDYSHTPVPEPFGTRAPATGGQDEKPRRANVKPEKSRRTEPKPEKTYRAEAKPDKSRRTDAKPEKTQRTEAKPDKSRRTDVKPEKTQRAEAKPDKTQRTEAKADKSRRTDAKPEKTQRAEAKPDKSRRTGVNPDSDRARGGDKTQKYADVKHTQPTNTKPEPDRGRDPVRDQARKPHRAEAKPQPGYARAQDRKTRQEADVEPQPDYARGQDKKSRRADPQAGSDRDRKKHQDPKPSRHDDPRPRGRSRSSSRPKHDPVYDDIITTDNGHRRGRSTPPPRTKHNRVDDDRPRGRHDGKREKSRLPKTKHRDPSPRADQNPFTGTPPRAEKNQFADAPPRGARDRTMPQPHAEDFESPFNDDFFRRARDRMRPQFPPADLGGDPFADPFGDDPFADPFFQPTRTRTRTGGYRARADPLGVDSYLAGTFADLDVMAEGLARRFGRRHASRSRRA